MITEVILLPVRTILQSRSMDASLLLNLFRSRMQDDTPDLEGTFYVYMQGKVVHRVN
jgi:hypothetical protein